MGHRIFRARRHALLTAKWTFRVSGTPAVAVAAAVTGVAEAAQPLRAARQLRQALQHLRQAPRLGVLVQHRPQRQAGPRLRVAPARRQLAAAAVVVAVAAISPAHPTPMAPLTPTSAKWLAIPTACHP